MHTPWIALLSARAVMTAVISDAASERRRVSHRDCSIGAGMHVRATHLKMCRGQRMHVSEKHLPCNGSAVAMDTKSPASH